MPKEKSFARRVRRVPLSFAGHSNQTYSINGCIVFHSKGQILCVPCGPISKLRVPCEQGFIASYETQPLIISSLCELCVSQGSSLFKSNRQLSLHFMKSPNLLLSLSYYILMSIVSEKPSGFFTLLESL